MIRNAKKQEWSPAVEPANRSKGSLVELDEKTLAAICGGAVDVDLNSLAELSFTTSRLGLVLN